MANDKENPTDIESDYVAKATDELEKSVAADLEADDPLDADEIIDALTALDGADEDEVEEEEVEEEVEPEAEATEETPVRHRGPREST